MTQNTFHINGRIINQENQQGIMGLRVEAWDKDLIFNDLVGQAITDAEGAFHVEIDESYYQECFLDRNPDLFFKVLRGDELILSTEDSVLWNISVGATDLVIKVPGDISLARAPVVFMFQPTRFEVVTGEKLRVWEAYMREHVGLARVGVTGMEANTPTISYSGPGPDSAPDDCDSD